MLNFIVLGEIPGTHSQVTFYGVLLFWMITAVVGLIIYLIRTRKIMRHFKDTQAFYQFISLSLTKDQSR